MITGAAPVLLVAVFGCRDVSLDDSGGPSATSDTAVEWPTPVVTIVGPASPVAGPDFVVTVEVENFQLEPMMEPTTLVPRPGPFDWLLASAHASLPGAPRGFVVVLLDGLEVTRGATLEHQLTGVAPGTHELGVELRWADNHTFFPAVVDAVELVVQ